LLYGSETWTINPLNAELNPICHLLELSGAHPVFYVSGIRVKARDARRITAAEMKYMRSTAGYIWTDYKTNRQIAKELKITPVSDKITGIQEKLDTTCK
jgi:hypothetical protein